MDFKEVADNCWGQVQNYLGEDDPRLHIESALRSAYAQGVKDSAKESSPRPRCEPAIRKLTETKEDK